MSKFVPRLLLSWLLALASAWFVSQWNVRSGVAVGIALFFIATVAAWFEIGAKRLLSLALFAASVKIYPKGAGKIIASTESHANRGEDDWLSNWIAQAWRQSPPRLAVSVILVVVSLTVSIAIAMYDSNHPVVDAAWIAVPPNKANDPLNHRSVQFGYLLSTCMSVVALSAYSAALRRVFIATASIGFCFGGVVGLSVGQALWLGACFVVLFLSQSVIGSLIAIWGAGQDEDTGEVCRGSTTDPSPPDSTQGSISGEMTRCH